MKKEQKLNSLMEMVKGLSESEQATLAERIMKMLAKPDLTENPDMCHNLIAEISPEKPDCPHCAAKANLGYIIKRGRCKGAQCYYCKACGKYFVHTTNTTFAYSRKDAETWRKFIRLTISAKSLHECAEGCDIAYQTAFTWRHKVLNAFATNQEETQMTGTVEVDEMLIPISYKGNHVQGCFGKRDLKRGVINDTPREVYKRGTDNKSKSSKEKACVFCMVENGSKIFFAAVPGIGFMNDALPEATVPSFTNNEPPNVVLLSYIRGHFVYCPILLVQFSCQVGTVFLLGVKPEAESRNMERIIHPT